MDKEKWHLANKLHVSCQVLSLQLTATPETKQKCKKHRRKQPQVHRPTETMQPLHLEQVSLITAHKAYQTQQNLTPGRQ